MNHIEVMKQALEVLTEPYWREEWLAKRDAAITSIRTAIEQAEKQEPLTDSFVQQVPDKCDRIVWRGSYYHLPPAAQRQPLTITDAQYDAAIRESGLAYLSNVSPKNRALLIGLCRAAIGITKAQP